MTFLFRVTYNPVISVFLKSITNFHEHLRVDRKIQKTELTLMLA